MSLFSNSVQFFVIVVVRILLLDYKCHNSHDNIKCPHSLWQPPPLVPANVKQQQFREAEEAREAQAAVKADEDMRYVCAKLAVDINCAVEMPCYLDERDDYDFMNRLLDRFALSKWLYEAGYCLRVDYAGITKSVIAMRIDFYQDRGYKREEALYLRDCSPDIATVAGHQHYF